MVYTTKTSSTFIQMSIIRNSLHINKARHKQGKNVKFVD